jgi:MYXO-CTERM domain-containing protein
VHRSPIHLSLTFALATLATACAPSEPPREDAALGATEQPVYLGEPASGDDAVVALTHWGQSFCSGTLITPTVVLTAAHCVPQNIGTDIKVFFGPDTDEEGTFVKATETWAHPGWSDNSLYFDVGLVRLAEPGPVEPMPWHESGDIFVEYEPVRIVGFGITGEDQGGGGLKREGSAVIDEFDAHVLTLAGSPSGTCSGDSGGATIMDIEGQDTLVGVHSRADCWGVSIEMRTDKYASDINDFIGDPECEENGQCALSCPFPDPDCPCRDDGYCTDLCPEPETDPDCPATCVADDFCDPTCESDPDCACAADDICDPSCASDPDCGCGGDGFCAAGCETPDPDCQAKAAPCGADGECDATCALDPDCGDEIPPPANQANGGGCAVTSNAPTSDVEALWLLGLGALMARRRRR